jgi:hypothetical protein
MPPNKTINKTGSESNNCSLTLFFFICYDKTLFGFTGPLSSD